MLRLREREVSVNIPGCLLEKKKCACKPEASFGVYHQDFRVGPHKSGKRIKHLNVHISEVMEVRLMNVKGRGFR